MLRKTLVLAVALAGAVSIARGQATMESLEDAIEASTLSVSLPESVPSRWNFRPCPTCNALALTMDANSAFFVGRDPVSLAMLRKYAARGTNNLDIFSDPRSKRVTRVILRTELDAADRASLKAPAKH